MRYLPSARLGLRPACSTNPRLLIPILAWLMLGISSPAHGESVVLAPVADNTLIQEGANDRSNGAGEYLFVGKTDTGNIRRLLVRFDVAGSIPPGSTITGATLTFFCSRAKVNTADAFELHRALVSWGEATANSGGQEGSGTAAVTGDVTWLYRFYPTLAWGSPGGDMSGTVSASTAVGANGQSYSWSAPGMTVDLQSWLDAPAGNFGWVLLGGESEASRSA
ncbi:MAG TPA: DNRLRE domain-containing protein, partial [Candidatus Eisenbacteria bacterium]